MTVDAAKPSVFDAGLPTLEYDFTATPQDIYPQFRAAQQVAPIALGPIGPEVLSYELARTVLRDPRFVIPPGIHLSAHGITSGPLWDRVTRSILNMEGEEHRRLRSLVSRAFTPRATARMHHTIHAVINELIDDVIDLGRCNSSPTSRAPTRYRSSVRCWARLAKTGSSSHGGPKTSSRSSASTATWPQKKPSFSRRGGNSTPTSTT
jgi:cytochrome P450